MKPKKSFNINKANIYDFLYLDAEYPDKIISFADRYMHWRNADSIMKYFYRVVRKEKKRRFNVLDVGCGQGYIAFKLTGLVCEDCSLQLTGIDNYKPAIDFANARKGFLDRGDCRFELMDACNLKFEKDFFDIVICSQVIEHLKNPQLAVKEIYRVLKKGGMAIITTPNKREDGLTKFAKFILEKLFKYKKTNLPQDMKDKHPMFNQETIHHISVKNHKEWTEIFKQSKFSLQTKIGTGGMLYNNKFFEKDRILFGLMVIFDTLLENAPFSYLWSEAILFVLKKQKL